MAEATTETTAPKTTSKAASEEAPVSETSLHIEQATATYGPGKGNWSDPPELAEHEAEYEGSFAAPPESEVAKEREKIEKEGKERRAKALEDNDAKARERAVYDQKKAKEAKA